MQILVLGGTGAMGIALVDILVKKGHLVDVTSRKCRCSDNSSLRYIQGNAHDNHFLSNF